jgi:hypothetical protein
LVEHWNGTKWKVVPSPNVSSNDIGDLFGIDVVTSKNAWAVGYSGPPTARQTLIEHWNGTVWKIQQSPNHAGATVNTLVDVSGVSSTDAWAVGSYMDGSTSRTLIEHWNGSHWTVQPSANVGPTNNELDGVVATSPTNAWAVGVREQGVNKTLVEHWNGTTWKVQQSANVGTGANALADIDASSNSNAWAVGFRDSSGTIQTLALQCC